MDKISHILNNRELILIIIFAIIIFFLLIFKSTRKSLFGILKMVLLDKKLLFILFLFTFYIVSIVCVLNLINVWNLSLLKDTIFWYVGSAIVLLYNENKALEDDMYFTKIIQQNLKFIIIIEFILNFFTFSIITEIFLLLLGTTYVVKPSKILNILAWILIFYEIYLIIINFNIFATYNSIISFLLPLILFFLIIPFLYFLAVFMAYDMILRYIKYNIKDKSTIKLIKKILHNRFKCNLKKINIAKNRINFFNSKTVDSLVELLNEI